MERLVSAYTDKITSLQPEPFSLYDTIRRAICRRFSSFYLTKDEQKVYQRHRGLERQLNEPCAKKIPSLDHFVEYLSADSVQADVHWHPYSTLCHVCTLKYNFIGKYETLEDDFRSFLSGVGLNSSEWNRNNPYSTGRSKDHYRSMYSQLSDRSICFLKYFYREDLKNFNYQFEDYFPDRRKIDCSSAHFRSFRKPV